MVRSHEDLYGKVFSDSKLIVISHPCKILGQCYYTVMCYCGVRTFVQSGHLTDGSLVSCGCYRKERMKGNTIGEIHGLSRTSEYQAYDNMMGRCYNENFTGYEHYGGRGIKVCDRWRYSRITFLSDMGKKPESEYSLDRINNSGNYGPSNCRWANWKQQNNNQRKRRSYV